MFICNPFNLPVYNVNSKNTNSNNHCRKNTVSVEKVLFNC